MPCLVSGCSVAINEEWEGEAREGAEEVTVARVRAPAHNNGFLRVSYVAWGSSVPT